jgi:hypothetical protein
MVFSHCDTHTPPQFDELVRQFQTDYDVRGETSATTATPTTTTEEEEEEEPNPPLEKKR